MKVLQKRFAKDRKKCIRIESGLCMETDKSKMQKKYIEEQISDNQMKESSTVKKVQKRTIESREKINQAAYVLFSQKGYFNTNTKEIAKLAGVSVGNFYNYYKDKGDVYYALTKAYLEGSMNAVAELSEILATADNPKEEFWTYINSQMERADDVGCFFEDCQVLVRDSERMKNIFEDGTKKMLLIIENVLKRTKGIKKRTSYPVMARFLYHLINEMTGDILKTKGTPIYREYLDQLVEVVIHYIYGEENA